jgi:hypothetical protein
MKAKAGRKRAKEKVKAAEKGQGVLVDIRNVLILPLIMAAV